ncbi:hypothetical protein O3M35_000672 [Rhynocoris fuscipes]|uniref:Plastocyanin-like domain-containing protein n=1 Tax=Rhynocoris fuscipes TaxID=488301 RepID=A0AAW1DSD5_9HEMI
MVNNQSFEFPPSPLISQYNDIPKDMFCKSYCPGNCTCANVVRIPLNYEVTIIVSDFISGDYDFNGPSHPFHLHGYNFNVLEMGVYNTSISEGMREVRRRVDSGLVNNPRAAMKDSISVPSGGYIIIRFIANNPGFWLLHCHFLYHLDTGMEVVLWVGEFSDLPPVPKGFPKCNNYIPKAECYD